MPVIASRAPEMSDSGLSPEALSGLLRSAPDLVRIADERNVVVYASGAAHELLGCGPSDVVGHPVTEPNHPHDPDVLAAASRQALATGRSVRRIHRARHRDGGYRWLETSVRVLTTARGRFAVLVSREAATHQGVRPVTGLPVAPSTSVDEWGMPDGPDAGDMAQYLTDRERQVLCGLGRGLSVSVLADLLHVQESTLRGHVKSILQKLHVHSQLQAVLVGMRAGVVPEVDHDVALRRG